jgi:extracellular matrix protein 14
LLPSEHIVPTGEEMLNALKYLGDYLLGNNGIEQSVFEQPSASWKDLKRRRR